MLTLSMDGSRDFDRVIRNENGDVVSVAENSLEDYPSGEAAAGVYCFDDQWLRKSLQRLFDSTEHVWRIIDFVGLASNQGQQILTMPIEDSETFIRVNNRVQLSQS